MSRARNRELERLYAAWYEADDGKPISQQHRMHYGKLMHRLALLRKSFDALAAAAESPLDTPGHVLRDAGLRIIRSLMEIEEVAADFRGIGDALIAIERPNALARIVKARETREAHSRANDAAAKAKDRATMATASEPGSYMAQRLSETALDFASRLHREDKLRIAAELERQARDQVAAELEAADVEN